MTNNSILNKENKLKGKVVFYVNNHIKRYCVDLDAFEKTSKPYRIGDILWFRPNKVAPFYSGTLRNTRVKGTYKYGVLLAEDSGGRTIKITVGDEK